MEKDTHLDFWSLIATSRNISNHTLTITWNLAMNGIVVFLALSKDKPHKSNVDMIEYDKRFLAHEGIRERDVEKVGQLGEPPNWLTSTVFGAFLEERGLT